MFLGTYAPKLDDKGRIILPAKFRDELSTGIVMTRGQENCLYVFSTREFEELHEKIRQAPITSKQGQLRREGSSLEVELATLNQNRSRGDVSIDEITADLERVRAYAGLDRELTVIGAGSRVEIWDSEAWETYLAEQETSFANTTEEVIPGLF